MVGVFASLMAWLAGWWVWFGLFVCFFSFFFLACGCYKGSVSVHIYPFLFVLFLFSSHYEMFTGQAHVQRRCKRGALVWCMCFVGVRLTERGLRMMSMDRLRRYRMVRKDWILIPCP